MLEVPAAPALGEAEAVAVDFAQSALDVTELELEVLVEFELLEAPDPLIGVPVAGLGMALAHFRGAQF